MGKLMTEIEQNKHRHSEADEQNYASIGDDFEASQLSVFSKMEAFPRFTTKRSMARFLCKHELYKKIIETNGYIVECGVLNGAGLFTWAQMASIYEPSNYNRRIVGFDTFDGFPEVSDVDTMACSVTQAGDLRGDTLESLQRSIQRYHAERYLSHIPVVELVPGDFMKTGQAWIERNPQALVALLYLDFDLYEPTKEALDTFLPRMGKGSIVCFDEALCQEFVGETKAYLESFGSRYQLRRFPTDPWISYVVL
jgi:hypothetical protein